MVSPSRAVPRSVRRGRAPGGTGRETGRVRGSADVEDTFERSALQARRRSEGPLRERLRGARRSHGESCGSTAPHDTPASPGITADTELAPIASGRHRLEKARRDSNTAGCVTLSAGTRTRCRPRSQPSSTATQPHQRAPHSRTLTSRLEDGRAEATRIATSARPDRESALLMAAPHAHEQRVPGIVASFPGEKASRSTVGIKMQRGKNDTARPCAHFGTATTCPAASQAFVRSTVIGRQDRP